MGNGKWDERDIRIFKGIGDWLKVNGEAVYDTQKQVYLFHRGEL